MFDLENLERVVEKARAESFGSLAFSMDTVMIDTLIRRVRTLEAVAEAAQAYLDDILRLDNVNEDHLIQIIDAGATQWDLEEALADLQHKDA